MLGSGADDLRGVPEVSNRPQNLRDYRLRRIEADIESVFRQFHAHFTDSRKPFQGLFHPIGSAHSGDALGLHKTVNADSDRVEDNLFPGSRGASSQDNRQNHR